MATNVLRVYAVPFAAYQQIQFRLRQTAWSEHSNILFKKSEHGKHACYSAAHINA